MNKLSAIIIAKNSEAFIADCIDSVSFCNEVIVVDNGSTDNTREIAKRMHAKVLKNDGDNFATQRNVGLAFASGEWVFYIDTDERVSEELRKSILSTISSESHQVYYVQRKNFYLGKHPWPKIEKLERLFKKSALSGWKGELHETPVYAGSVGVLDGYLLHFTHRDLSSMLNKTIVWSDIEAQLRLQSHHPKMAWWRFFRVMLTGFWDSYVIQGGWKVGTAGLIESMYQAFSMFITYAKLWELQQK